MPYQIDGINRALRTDAPGFLAACDARYERQIAAAAETALRHRKKSPVILLAGPSSSGKTTTANKLAQAMEHRGVKAHVISLDDYFRLLPPESTPYTETGLPDYESPLYLDTPLLNAHFAALSAGEPIAIPRFDFTLHRRSDAPGRELRLMPGEMAIFEGIHALGEQCAGRFPQALGIDVRAESDILSGDAVLLPHLQSRLCRRMVRDALFRGTPPALTLKMWGVVLRGERLYLSPARHRAAVTIDSALPYEAAVLRHRALPGLYAALRDNVPFPGLPELCCALKQFEPVESALVSPDSLLREFIGGS